MHLQIIGYLFRHRWNQNLQKLIIETVKPDIYPYQWPDAHFFHEYSIEIIAKGVVRKGLDFLVTTTEDCPQGGKRRKVPDCFLLPYINMEVLKGDPSKLLALLYNRLKHSPATWARHDYSLLQKDWDIGSFESIYNKNCIIMYGDNYGQMTVWKEDEVHNLSRIGFPRGILVLEAQQMLFSFLRRIVTTILEDDETAIQTWSPSFFTKTAEPKLKHAGRNSSSIEFASSYLNQAFSAPPQFDLDEINSIIQTRLAYYADHIWLLQTDAPYLRSYADIVLLGVGKFGGCDTIVEEGCAVVMAIERDIDKFLFWQGLAEYVPILRQQSELFLRNSEGCTALPEEYSCNLASFEAVLIDQIDKQSQYQAKSFIHRPGFRDKFEIKTMKEDGYDIVCADLLDQTQGISSFFFKDRLFWVLISLVIQAKDREFTATSSTRHDPAMLFSILDHLLEERFQAGDKKELSRLDEELYVEFSNLADMHHLLGFARSHVPGWQAHDRTELMKVAGGRSWRLITRPIFNVDQIPKAGQPQPKPVLYGALDKLRGTESICAWNSFSLVNWLWTYSNQRN